MDNSIIHNYISAVKSFALSNTNEHTYRPALQDLIEKLGEILNIKAINEGKDRDFDVDGAPDFFVYSNYDTLFKSLVGFVECKKIDYDLKKLLNSNQINKYSKSSENIIITNYIEFILLNKGRKIKSVSLLNKDLSEISNQNKFQDLQNLFSDFFAYEYEYIRTKKGLVNSLSSQSFYYSFAIRQFIENKENEANSFYMKFNQLFENYQKSLQYSCSLTDFCDIYAQSLVYGLMISRLDVEDLHFDESGKNFLTNIPEDYALLYEFLEAGYSERYIPLEIKQAVIAIGKNLNRINVEAIEQEFSKDKNGKNNIAVYLYEDFLKAYDVLRKTESREENGVYYTPKEIADFITRSVNDIIKSSFGKKDGFLNEGVKTLDFACGTGTFLHSILEIILNKDTDDLEKRRIKEKIINDIYGFELIYTPYIVAHTILSRYIRDNGIALDVMKNERLGIYLTNTLDIGQHSISDLLPNLKKEHEKSTRVKNEENILAIVGNPPYFNGKNNSAQTGYIDGLITDTYKKLNERKINLDDLYIKFIKFAEHKIGKAEQGLVGIITNNSFLDRDGRRKMRECLCNSFDEIYILNLHGDKELDPGDKNVFDITKGVCISFFIKSKNKNKKKKVYYYSTKDNDITKRQDKLEFLNNFSPKTIDWKVLKPEETDKFWFVSKDFTGIEEYDKFWKLTDIFKEYISGLEANKDEFCIKYKNQTLINLKNDIQNLSKDQISRKYKVEDSRDWKIEKAKNDLINNYNYNKINYRIFDIRHTSLSKKSGGFICNPRYSVMKNFDNKDNLGLCFKKQSNRDYFKTIFISDKIIDRSALQSSHGGSFVTPLYIYTSKNSSTFEVMNEEEGKSPNFTPAFTSLLATLPFAHTPEEIMAYIYAVMHSPIYRGKYIEFLKTDFPAVPFTKNSDTFHSYGKLGQKLIDIHLLSENLKDSSIKVNFPDNLDEFIIDKMTAPTHTENSLKLVTKENDFITFSNVTHVIWNFEIGSRRPIHEWIKDRIKYKVELSVVEDIQHIKNMIIAIKRTMEIMKEIEKLGEEYLKDI